MNLQKSMLQRSFNPAMSMMQVSQRNFAVNEK